MIVLLICFFSFIFAIPFVDTKSKFRLFFCNKMGWHKIDDAYTHKAENDPLKFLGYSRCKICGYEGLVDSQGNLF